MATRTPPQTNVSVHYDGELVRPKGIDPRFYLKSREMRRDPTIKLARWFATAPIVGGSWSVECEPGVPDGVKELIEQQMEYLRYDLLQTSLYGCYDFGWQGFEKCFALRDDGLYWCRYLKPLYHDWTYILVLEKTGEFCGFKQNPLTLTKYHDLEIYLSTEESLLMYMDAEGTNWYGEPAMKAAEKAYDDWNTCNRSAEKYDSKIAGSHWVIYYPRGTSPYNGVMTDNAVIADELAKSMRAVSSIAVPRSVMEVVDTLSAQAAQVEATQWKIELMSDKSGASTAIQDRLKYLDSLKVRAFGFPERALLEGTYGTKAEAESHADLGIMSLEMRHQGLTNLINRDLVNQTIRINFGPGLDDKCYLRPAPLTDEAKTFLRELYKVLVMQPEEMMQLDLKALRDRLKVPTLEYVDPAYVDPYSIDPMTGEPIYAVEVPADGLNEPEPIAFAYNPDQPRNELGQFDSGGPTVAKAKALGFRPSSRDAWINQQQAKEFIAKHKLEKHAEKRDKKLVERAEKMGFKPTSSDSFINARQAQQFIEDRAASRSNGERRAKSPKGNGKPEGDFINELIDATGGVGQQLREAATVGEVFDPKEIR